MAELVGNLWEWNLARIVVVDVTDDYRFMLNPMPGEFYPVLTEVWVPRHQVGNTLERSEFVDGYLYDWHEVPEDEKGSWYVGVVQEGLTKDEQFLAMLRRPTTRQ